VVRGVASLKRGDIVECCAQRAAIARAMVQGANALEEIVFGITPQVLPLWISYSLYRFESNVRSATVVGK